MEHEENKTPLNPEEETLIIVRKLWRAEKWRRFWTIFRYIAYIGIIFGAFYFLTPYIERLRDTIPPELQNILEKLQ
ncbi:MAG: hypothetical protein HYW79_03535 [Parcubacteria group bacterium]|nr:hypothetical protein [Parcubacteria group bacterium]